MSSLNDNEIKDAKVALHYKISQLGEKQSKKHSVQVSKEVLAALTEATYRFTQTLATDLEHFARHAKRSTVTPDDVRLSVRRNPSLTQHVEKLIGKMQQESESKEKTKKPKRQCKKKEKVISIDIDDDSNQHSNGF